MDQPEVMKRFSRRIERVPQFKFFFDKAFAIKFAETKKPVDIEDLSLKVLEDMEAIDPCEEIEHA